MISDDGEVRNLTDEEYRWAVRDADFGGVLESAAFLERRETILAAIEASGFHRDAFLHLEPAKPGFELRVADALDAVLKTARHAAE